MYMYMYMCVQLQDTSYTVCAINADWHKWAGITAAQLVPHVHFHVIPRPATNAPPSGGKVSFVMFGRGQRDELDDEEGEKLAGLLREELAREVGRVRKEEGIDLDLESGDDGKVLGKL